MLSEYSYFLIQDIINLMLVLSTLWCPLFTLLDVLLKRLNLHDIFLSLFVILLFKNIQISTFQYPIGKTCFGKVYHEKILQVTCSVSSTCVIWVINIDWFAWDLFFGRLYLTTDFDALLLIVIATSFPLWLS